jgi:hypothetical protein
MAFLSSAALLTGRYHVQPLAAHVPLPLENARRIASSL